MLESRRMLVYIEIIHKSIKYVCDIAHGKKVDEYWYILPLHTGITFNDSLIQVTYKSHTKICPDNSGQSFCIYLECSMLKSAFWNALETQIDGLDI